MVGKTSGEVTRLQNSCTGSVYRAWCEAHRLDLAGQSVLSEYVKESFKYLLTRLISSLPRRKYMIANMGSQYLTVESSRGLSAGTTFKYQKIFG